MATPHVYNYNIMRVLEHFVGLSDSMRTSQCEASHGFLGMCLCDQMSCGEYYDVHRRVNLILSSTTLYMCTSITITLAINL